VIRNLQQQISMLKIAHTATAYDTINSLRFHDLQIPLSAGLMHGGSMIKKIRLVIPGNFVSHPHTLYPVMDPRYPFVELKDTKGVIMQYAITSNQQLSKLYYAIMKADEHVNYSAFHNMNSRAIDWNKRDEIYTINRVTRYYTEVIRPKVFELLRIELESIRHKHLDIIEIGCGGAETLDRCVKLAVEKGFLVRGYGIDFVQREIDKANASIHSENIKYFHHDSLEIDKLLMKLYGEQHDEDRVVIMVAAGAINRTVLNSIFEAMTVLQKSHKYIDTIITSGVSEHLFTKSIAKRTGWMASSEAINLPDNITIESCVLKNIPTDKMAALILEKAMKSKNKTYLDLSMNSDPIAILENLLEVYTKKLESIDLSFCNLTSRDISALHTVLADTKFINLELITFDSNHSELVREMESACKNIDAYKLRAMHTTNERGLLRFESFFARDTDEGQSLLKFN